MCDYSLCGIPNRLAVEGEDLVVHRFSTGSMGLTSLADLKEFERLKAAAPRKPFLQRLKEFFELPSCFAHAIAVCVPPGTQLVLTNIPQNLRRRFDLGHAQAVVFTQISSEFNSYRDAVRFPNGSELRLQDLREGMVAHVVSLADASEDSTPALKEESLV